MASEFEDRLLATLDRIANALDRIADSSNGASDKQQLTLSKDISGLSRPVPTTDDRKTPTSAKQKSPPRPDPQSDILIGFLRSKGIEIKAIPPEREYDEILDELALFIGSRYDSVEIVIDNIKTAINTRRVFEFGLRGSTQQEIRDITRLCSRLHDLALLEHYQYRKAPALEIRGTPSLNPRAISFFTGQWLERYVEHQTINLCEEVGLSYSKIANPQVTLPNGDDFEFDLLFEVGGHVLWFEAKTGDYQRYVDKYSKLAKVLSIHPSRAFFISTEVPEHAADHLGALFDMSVLPVAQFEDGLREALTEIHGSGSMT